MTEAQRTHSPAIDELLERLAADHQLGNPHAAPEAILAVGRDLAHQLGRIADHLTIESMVALEHRSGFGLEPAGGHAPDPTIATQDPARGHRVPAATPSGPIVS